MPATSPARLSYDVFVSDGPVRAAQERMPDGSTQVFSPLSSTLVFGAEDAVLVDPPFTRTQIQNVGDWVERSGRRLAYIYATHGHGDHWFGTGELVKRFPGVTVYATAGTIEVMHQQAGPGRAAVGPGLPRPDPPDPGARRTHSRRGIPAGGKPGRGRRDRAHRHRQDHGAARALHRPGRRW